MSFKLKGREIEAPNKPKERPALLLSFNVVWAQGNRRVVECLRRRGWLGPILVCFPRVELMPLCEGPFLHRTQGLNLSSHSNIAFEFPALAVRKSRIFEWILLGISQSRPVR
jgi:hypothetical protein